MATKKTAPSPDPLADLREEDAPGLATVPENSPEPETEPIADIRPMVTEEVQEQMVSEAVAAWHLDPSAMGFLHGGGSMCGCRYIARVALRAAVPVLAEEDPEPTDG